MPTYINLASSFGFPTPAPERKSVKFFFPRPEVEMDTRSVPKVMESKRKTKRNNKSDSLKVVYISSPMKVKTSASRFRSLVQELTGRHSDVSRYMEANGADADFHEIVSDDYDRVLPKSDSSMHNCRESPTSTSDSALLDPIDNNVFSSQMDEQLGGVFSSSLLYDSCQFYDALGSYAEL